MENIITLELTIQEVNAVLEIIGQLPTSSGAYPLLMKIKQQGEAQVKQPEASEDGSEE